ncbi:unnamed protein product [Spirodela intermedia]|uniref:Uncharacterized protein n=1 Tax=Spirodela intermedia TaxID=51605 RepID=A0A7I8L738_SPIIN|nr:unnamed protein product [Spirodela intermedia]
MRQRSEGKKREIKAQSIVFSCSRLLWRRDYLEHIKIIIDQASLGLRLTHNEEIGLRCENESVEM